MLTNDNDPGDGSSPGDDPNGRGSAHLDNDGVRVFFDHWSVLWQQRVPQVGLLWAYALPWGIVLVLDFVRGGWEAFVPASGTNSIATTLSELEAWTNGDGAPR